MNRTRPGRLLPMCAVAPLLVLGSLCWRDAAGQATDLPAHRDTLVIPAGTKIRVDGIAKETEWADAETLAIRLSYNWNVRVLIKHDGKSLCCAFQGVVRDKEERYPEILLDTKGRRGARWDGDDWWLHASYTDCTGRGTWDEYGKACEADAWGWSANNFPLSSQSTVEFQIELDWVGIKPGPPRSEGVFGLALDVAESEQLRFYWPAGADIQRPDTWAWARLGPSPAAGSSHH